MWRVICLFICLFVWAPSSSAWTTTGTDLQTPDLVATFDEAVSAYRVGDLASAEAQLESLLGFELTPRDRSIVLFDLGNLAFRQGRFLAAVARYTAATDGWPRQPDLWHNLELARTRAGLEPADGGDLAATARRLVSLPTDRELRLAGWALFALLGLALGSEALFGGAGRRWAVALVAILFLADLALLETRALGHIESPAMVVRDGGAELRAEPNGELAGGAGLAPAERVEVLDRLGREGAPGSWVKVRSGTDTGWLPESEVFSW